jgi:hypothetical protein
VSCRPCPPPLSQEVRTDLKLWKHCLAEGNPIIFGLNLYESFDQQRIQGKERIVDSR